jgi:hypothetical protein
MNSDNNEDEPTSHDAMEGNKNMAQGMQFSNRAGSTGLAFAWYLGRGLTAFWGFPHCTNMKTFGMKIP